MGMQLQDRYAKESLVLAERFLKDGAVHVLLYLTAAAVLEAVKDDKEKGWIEAADATLWGDTEILKAAEITSRSRCSEVEEREFLQSFLRKSAKAHTSVLLLSDTEEHAIALKEELSGMQGGVTITGAMAIEDVEIGQERLINEINMIAPSVIIARMPFAMQHRWLKLAKQYMNARIWIGMPEGFGCMPQNEMPAGKVGKRILNMLISRKIHKYRK